MICVLCKKQFDEYEKIQMGDKVFMSVGGHNPAPLAKEGKCCSKCNYGKVLPARLRETYKNMGDGNIKN
jgi:hypothetical protein